VERLQIVDSDGKVVLTIFPAYDLGVFPAGIFGLPDVVDADGGETYICMMENRVDPCYLGFPNRIVWLPSSRD
jgi:hypothetical protein